MKQIKCLVMDVDGTLTDGGIYMSENGELFKKFNVRDGQAIKHILPLCGVEPIIITGRKSGIVVKRCEELDIKIVKQNSSSKVEDLDIILQENGWSFNEVAYIGDDINDLECMKKVEIKGCPADAENVIIDIVDFKSRKKGGEGAVREFIEWLIREGYIWRR